MILRGLIYSMSIIATVISGAIGQYCFRTRDPAGVLGRCQDEIDGINTTEECCREGGAGWTEKQNGKRCMAACSDNGQPPVTQPMPSEDDEEPNTPQPSVNEVKFCFRSREPSGRLGVCEDLIGESTRENCCRQGGKGWTDRQSGRRCEDSCQGVRDDGPVQYCFSRLTGRGRCVQSLGQKTRLRCCQDGGNGWSPNENGGRPCQSVCEELPQDVPQVIHGSWSEWSNWGQCSVTCEEGIQTRRRTCDNPAPAHGGNNCVGPPLEQAICDDGPCPIHGGWGEWINARECSATCYNEGQSVYRQMRRECDNPRPQFGGRPCEGPSIKNQRCLELPHCPVNGEWSEYGPWSACSQTCEEGIQIRRRTCTNPPPQHQGRDCEGSDTQQRVCQNRRICPIHGGWSAWGPWSPCDSPRCGVEGTKFRSRTCTNPKPQYRGNYCSGPIIDRVTCSKCPLPGGWSDWGPWGPCSGDCGKGDFRLRFRICNNPPPQNGGSCEGNYREIGECENLDPCPNNIGEGSGSGEGSGDNVPWPCDDEDSCNYGAGNDNVEHGGDSFSYSNYLSIDVPEDVTPESPGNNDKSCEDYPLYSISEYNDVIGCQENEYPGVVEEGVGEGGAQLGVEEPESGSDHSDSYSFDDEGGNAGQVGVQPSVPQKAVEEINDYSDSYSFDDVANNVGQGFTQGVVEENNDSDSYSYED